MKRVFSALIMLWLLSSLSLGYSQSQNSSARQEKQAFVYILEGQPDREDYPHIQSYRVRRNGTLQSIPQDDIEIGQFPRTLAVVPRRHALYVGSDSQPNDIHPGLIYEFTIRKNGLLVPLGAIDAGYLPLRLAADPSGSFLYCTAEDGVTNQGLIYQYRIKPDGSLAPLTPAFLNLGANYLQFLDMHPSGKYLYAPTMGVPICFRIKRNGTLSRLPSAPTQIAAKEMAIDPSGQYAYLLQKNNIISVAKIDLHTGSLSNLRTAAHVSRGAVNMTINPQQHTLHIINPASFTVSQFQISPDGVLKLLIPPTFKSVGAYHHLGVDSTGQFVYVTVSQ